MRQALNATKTIYERKFNRRHNYKDNEERSLDARQRDKYIHEIKSQLHY
jgi:hypothetical protein